MKTPRIEDFDPTAAERKLGSPLDDMPAIEKPRPQPQQPVQQLPNKKTGQKKAPSEAKGTRRYVRRTFDYFEDQIEYLNRVSLQEKLAGRNHVTMASMLREALDRYIAEKASKK